MIYHSTVEISIGHMKKCFLNPINTLLKEAQHSKDGSFSDVLGETSSL